MFREIQRGLRVPAAPPGAASICHMRKVAETHVSAFHRGRRGAHYCLGGVDATHYEIAKEIAEILDRPGPLVILPAWLFRLAGRIEYRFSRLIGADPMLTPPMADILCETVLCDSAKAIEELGYNPSNLATMLMDCYQWMVATKLLPARSGAGSTAAAV